MTGVMMGIDVTDAAAWARRLVRTPDLGRTAFTARELIESGGDPHRLAMVWAVKEAVVKALGTGFDGVGWRGVEIQCHAGRPSAVRVDAPRPPAARTLRLALRIAGPGDEGRRPVVAAVALGDPARTAARVERIAGLADGPRAGRADRASAAARRTAERAAGTLVAATGWRWDRTRDGAPLLRTRSGRKLAVALSHCGGLVAAVVAVPRQRILHNHRPSRILNVIDGDYLLEGVSVHG